MKPAKSVIVTDDKGVHRMIIESQHGKSLSTCQCLWRAEHPRVSYDEAKADWTAYHEEGSQTVEVREA